jgi:hypothetical protein
VQRALMPVVYTISSEDRLIRALATGIIRADDLHRLIKSLLDDPALIPGLRGLYDSRLAEPEITVMQLAEIAGEARELLNRGLGRIALVAQSRTTYRVEQTFAILARAMGIDVAAFRDLAAAEAWLREDPDGPDRGERLVAR